MPRRRAGQTIDLANGDVSCVTEVETGTLLPHTICHTRDAWRDIKLQREIEKALWVNDRRLASAHIQPPTTQ